MYIIQPTYCTIGEKGGGRGGHAPQTTLLLTTGARKKKHGGGGMFKIGNAKHGSYFLIICKEKRQGQKDLQCDGSGPKYMIHLLLQ